MSGQVYYLFLFKYFFALERGVNMNSRKNDVDKAKKMAIMIENLVNLACENILNVKTQTLSQTASRDSLARQIGDIFSKNVVNNKEGQTGTNQGVAKDYTEQFIQARNDYKAMAEASAIIDKRFPRKARTTHSERAMELLNK